MRLPDSPMTDDEFDYGLAQALKGWIVSDLGAGDDLDAAFFAITEAAPSVPPQLIQQARDAYAAQRSDSLGS